MKMPSISALISVVSLLFGAIITAPAGPLQLNAVPHDVSGLLHFDNEAFRATQLGEFINDVMEDEPELMLKMDEAAAEFGFDIRKDIHSVTVYFDGKEMKGDGVMMLKGKFDREKLFELAGKNDAFEDIGNGIHAWTDRGKQAYGHMSADDQTLVFSDSEEQVTRAIATLAGGRSLAEANPNEVPVAAEGSFMFIGATGFADMPGLRAQAAMLRQAESFVLTVRENDGRMESLLTLTTLDEDSAESLGAIANGMFQFAKGHAAKDPVAKRLMKSMTVAPEGAAINATFSHPTQDLIGIVEDKMDEMREWRENHDDGDRKHRRGKRGKKGDAFEL